MKTIKIGADPFPPYQYTDKEGKLKGTDYEIISSIISKMNYDAEYFILDWPRVASMFDNKELDMIFQVQKTRNREKKWYFSELFREAVTSIITASNTSIYKEFSDLFEENKKLGVLKDYEYGKTIEQIKSDNLVYFDSLEQILEAVNEKK